jgi:hypothetical protein
MTSLLFSLRHHAVDDEAARHIEIVGIQSVTSVWVGVLSFQG